MRYDRQMILPEIGEDGQQKLKQAKVLIVGVGGLGSPIALYLTGAGVGCIGLVDDDVVSISNLQRQVLYSEKELGKPKAICAAERLSALNSEITIRTYPIRLTEENAQEIISQYDIVVDGCDNFSTRYLINDICAEMGKVYVYGAICGFEGQVSVFHYGEEKKSNFAKLYNFTQEMKLIVVTTPTFFVEEDKIITALFEEGLDILHLRKPETPAMYSERLLTLIPEKYHRRIVTHEHFYLKEEFNLMGIHLNARNPSEPHDYAGHVSCSCHSVEEVKNRKHFYDYIFMSPIYDSISKVNYYSTYTAEELREAQKAKIIDSKVMALGGINEDNLLEIKDFGFGGAVVLGDLWNKFDACLDQNYLAVIEHFKKLKKLAD